MTSGEPLFTLLEVKELVEIYTKLQSPIPDDERARLEGRMNEIIANARRE